MGTLKCKIGYVWSLLIAVCLTVVPRYYELSIDSMPVLTVPAVPAAPKTPQVVEDTIHKNTTIVATLVDYDVPVAIANEVADLIKPVFDVRQLRFGNAFRLEKEQDGTLREFEYKIDDERVLKVKKDADSYAAKVEKVDLEQRQEVITAEIKTSLWRALGSKPKGEFLVNSVANVFAWDVDFNNGIQRGDQIRIVVDAQYHEGKLVKYGKVQAAELINKNHAYHAYLFKDEYYDDKGNTLRRALLISPLQFNARVTSGFSRARLHPILGDVRAHLAVDLGAPTGTPVIAVANGTIVTAGWSGGYGNFVQIKHNNGLITGYGHLSKIAAGMHPGVSIHQGEVIGLVGATGLATGPHLHYMMLRAGKPINPQSVKSEPPAPISPALKGEYFQHIAGMQVQLKNQVALK